ncbi:MAG: nitroreductase family protein [Elusimicrobiota bacterium]
MAEPDFEKSVIDVIKSRISFRSYENQPLNPDLQKQIENLIPACVSSLPFGNEIVLKLINSTEIDIKISIMGTYGMITGAQTYIAGKVKKSQRGLEDFGYAMEKLIIHLTDINLGTCWLGGSFNRHDFVKLLDVQTTELIPAITPVGVVVDDLRHKALRKMFGSRNRKPWNELFYDKTFNTAFTKDVDAGEYAVPFEMVRIAPSASNRQPWRLVKDGKDVHFFIERLPSYQAMLKVLGVDLQRVDLGIAMAHFTLTCSAVSISGGWQVLERCPVLTLPPNTEYITSWIKR